ncbi:MAG: DUF2306 domain-containing protein [Verrucomicrobiales bacterium]|nr:DUF2306 domain-containing protein [Verrucomicrobiales bacterium]
MPHLTKSEWRVLSGLLFLSLVPCLGGLLRLIDLGAGTSLMPENPRIGAVPLPVVIHLIGSIPFCVLGILQFLPGVRRTYPYWHRKSGRLLVITGLLAAISGLWMTHFYHFPAELQGPLLYWVRIIVGFGMIASLAMGLTSILLAQISAHKAWMLRAYALGQGAGTQALIGIPWALLYGESTGLTRDTLMTLAWIINLVIAETVIRKPGSHSSRTRRSPEITIS